MHKHIFLDAYVKPIDVRGNKIYKYLNWTVCKNFAEFMRIMVCMTECPDVVSVAHDLDVSHSMDTKKLAQLTLIPHHWQLGVLEDYYNEMEEKTGWTAIQWLLQHCRKRQFKVPIILVHQNDNPIGTQNILDLLDDYENKQLVV